MIEKFDYKEAREIPRQFDATVGECKKIAGI
jgi:hypothetical protein